MNLGDISVGQILYFHFTTRQFSTGAPITSANLVLSVYKDDNVTQSTAGITTTFTTGFDGVVGLVSVKIDTSADGTFYAAAHDFSVVITTGTSDSVSIVGEVVGYFSIANRSALRPTTAGRTLVVDAAGIADANTVKLGPTGSGTAQTARDIGASVLVGDKTGFALTSSYDPAKTAAQAGDAMTLTTGERTSVGTAVWATATRTLTSFGTLAADVWGVATRTLTAFGFTVNTNANATETAIQAKTDLIPAVPASTTNITAGTITTVTNLTNAPTSGDFTADMKTSLNDATPAVTVSDKTGFALTAAYDPAKTAAQAGDAMTLSAAYDASKTAAQAGDSMDVSTINGTAVIGTGQAGDLWRA